METVAEIKKSGMAVIDVDFTFDSKDAFATAAGEHSEHLGHIVHVNVSNKVELKLRCTGQGCDHEIAGHYAKKEHCWVVERFVDHAHDCTQGQMQRKRCNYDAKTLALCIVPELLANLNVKPGKLATVLHRHTFFETTTSNRTYIKELALKMLMHTPAEAVSKLPAVVHLLKKQGHAVKLLTMNPAEMKQIMLEVEKSKHERLVSEYKKKSKQEEDDDPGKFDPTKYNTECCDNCESGTRFVYGILFAPCTSIALYKAGRGPLVSVSDAAHMFVSGTMLANVFQNSGHRTQELAIGLVYDNERYDSWNKLYRFQSKAYGASMNTAEDRNIGDQDKGMERAYAETFNNGTKFNCANHLRDTVQARGGTQGLYLFLQAVKAKSRRKCDSIKDQFPENLRQYLSKFNDEVSMRVFA